MELNEFSMKLDKKLEEAISEYPLKTIPPLTYFQEAVNLMNKHVWTTIYLDNPTAEPMAAVKKSGGIDGVYEIYVNPYVDNETRNCFLLHEFGHVLYTHLEVPIIQEEFLTNKMNQLWPKLQKYFDCDKISSTVIIQNISNLILNIAQDLEINGKLYTQKEWDLFVHNSQLSYISAQIHSPNCTVKTKLEIYKWLETPEYKREPLFLGFHPTHFCFPTNLTYSHYVDLILENADFFFKNLIITVKNSLIISASENSDKGKLSIQEIENINGQINSKNTPAEVIVESPTEMWHGQKCLNFGEKRKLKNKLKINTFDNAKAKQIEDFILRHCFNTSRRNVQTDAMYYYNRKKYDSNLMIQKNRDDEKYHPGSIYLLVDCSGSINYEAIKIMISIIQRISRKLEQHSRIIWWSASLCGDYRLKNFQPPAECDGTYLAKGINYIHRKYLKHSNDKLIIVSDYYDSLESWYKELSSIKNDCMGICWRNGRISERPALYRNLFDVDESKTAKFYKKIPTTFISI